MKTFLEWQFGMMPKTTTSHRHCCQHGTCLSSNIKPRTVAGRVCLNLPAGFTPSFAVPLAMAGRCNKLHSTSFLCSHIRFEKKEHAARSCITSFDSVWLHGCVLLAHDAIAASHKADISLLGHTHHQAVPVVQPYLLHTHPRKRWYHTSCQALLHGVTLHL